MKITKKDYKSYHETNMENYLMKETYKGSIEEIDLEISPRR